MAKKSPEELLQELLDIAKKQGSSKESLEKAKEYNKAVRQKPGFKLEVGKSVIEDSTKKK